MSAPVRAAVLRAPGAPLAIEQLKLGELRSHEVVVRLVATGICHTDIAVMSRPFPVEQPIVLGHEGAGIVEAVGSAVSSVKPGDRVVMSYASCGNCTSCAALAPMYCEYFFGANFLGQRPDGSTALSSNDSPVRHSFFGQSSFATHSVCTERNVVKVSPSAPLEMLGPLGCGIQTGAGAIFNVLKPSVGQSLAVFGVGSVGLAAVLAAQAIGVGTIMAIDLDDRRLALALELGATHAINPARTDTVAEIRSLTGVGVNLSFETTGSMKVLRQAVDCLSSLGVCGFVGASAPGAELPLDVRDMMSRGKSIRGIVEGDANSQVFIPMLIRLHEQGRFPFDRLLTFYPFDDIEQALADSISGKVVKAVLRFPEPEPPERTAD